MTERLTISCPVCARPLVERTNRLNGTTFLGCTGYPECQHTQGIPEYLKLLRQGYWPLPGFDL